MPFYWRGLSVPQQCGCVPVSESEAGLSHGIRHCVVHVKKNYLIPEEKIWKIWYVCTRVYRSMPICVQGHVKAEMNAFSFTQHLNFETGTLTELGVSSLIQLCWLAKHLERILCQLP